MSLAAGAPGEALRVLEALCDEALTLGKRLSDAVGDRLGAVRVDANGRLAGRLVE
jgi:hypothetical protein